MTEPKVSVVIPVRNGMPFLPLAISSIQEQTFRPIEIIVVDDHSTDGSGDYVRSLRDSRIKTLVAPEPGGIARALNLGIAQAQSELIARMDSDDISTPDRLHRQMAALRTMPTVAVLGSRALYYSIARPRGFYTYLPLSQLQCAAALFFMSPVAHPTVLMRRSVIENCCCYRTSEVPSEDYGLWARVAEIGEIANLDATLLHYRVHDKSVSATSAVAQAIRAAEVASAYLRYRLPQISASLAAEWQRFMLGSRLHTVYVGPVADQNKVAAIRNIVLRNMANGNVAPFCAATFDALYAGAVLRAFGPKAVVRIAPELGPNLAGLARLKANEMWRKVGNLVLRAFRARPL